MLCKHAKPDTLCVPPSDPSLANRYAARERERMEAAERERAAEAERTAEAEAKTKSAKKPRRATARR